MFWRRNKSKLAEPQKEPLFASIRNDDEELRQAYAHAAASMDRFVEHIHRDGAHICAAKLRFKDPAQSERLGEDRFAFIWLAGVSHDRGTARFSGTFFEVPRELAPWYQVGQRVEFGSDEVLDWFVNDDGNLHGGYTLRVARARLPMVERRNFDHYTGVKHWVPAGGV